MRPVSLCVLLCLSAAPAGQATGMPGRAEPTAGAPAHPPAATAPPEPQDHWTPAERALARQVQQVLQARARTDILARQQRHAQLRALSCQGQVRVAATLPPAPDLASCVDLRFGAYCPGAAPIHGVLTTWGGATASCGAHSAPIPDPACALQDMRVVAESATACR